MRHLVSNRAVKLAVGCGSVKRFIMSGVNCQGKTVYRAGRLVIGAVDRNFIAVGVVDKFDVKLIGRGGRFFPETEFFSVRIGNEFERSSHPPSVKPLPDKLLRSGQVAESLVVGKLNIQIFYGKRIVLKVRNDVVAFEKNVLIIFNLQAACVVARYRARIGGFEIYAAVNSEEIFFVRFALQVRHGSI